MKVLFLSLSKLVRNLNNHAIYPDLLRMFAKHGHEVYIVCPYERRENKQTNLISNGNVHVLGIKTLNITKSSFIEKGIAALLIEKQYNKAINRYFKNTNFDLILYSTPPVTFNNMVKTQKMRNPKAISYLLLKDIFPQNAVDIGIVKKGSLIHKFFIKKEQNLYSISDYIGCMSPANVDYIVRNNPSINPCKVEIAPNSMEYVNNQITESERIKVRLKYKLPTDKPILIYGGNIGKPQGIDYVIKCLEDNGNRTDCHFIIIGNGTEYGKLEKWIKQVSFKNVSLIPFVPKEEYDIINKVCDIGLIFLDHRFTIPNYPSRLLGYLECKMPIIAATDKNTDIGKIAQENGYGVWCESVHAEDFTACVDRMLISNLKEMGEKGHYYLLKHYKVENTYNVIVSHIKQ